MTVLKNNLRKIREHLLLTKAELARKSGLSVLTIDRVEAGYNCRMDTKRKIVLALGLPVADHPQVFGPPDEAGAEEAARKAALPPVAEPAGAGAKVYVGPAARDLRQEVGNG